MEKGSEGPSIVDTFDMAEEVAAQTHEATEEEVQPTSDTVNTCIHLNSILDAILNSSYSPLMTKSPTPTPHQSPTIEVSSDKSSNFSSCSDSGTSDLSLLNITPLQAILMEPAPSVETPQLNIVQTNISILSESEHRIQDQPILEQEIPTHPSITPQPNPI